MKHLSFHYHFSRNLGDDIQSIAAEQFLPAIDGTVNRDHLRIAERPEKGLVIMNGWFSHTPERCFPPAQSFVPCFLGFHLTNWNRTREHFLSEEGVEYFKRHEPVGCRDQETMKLLQQRGIEAFYSKCLTLTFPRREFEPENGKVFLVDVEDIPLPDWIENCGVQVSHEIDDFWGHEIKHTMARRLLTLYRDYARLVITTRLHCALPCMAMGIPVIFFGDENDYRIGPVLDLGLNVNPCPPQWFRDLYRHVKDSRVGAMIRKLFTHTGNRSIDWDPSCIDVESEKQHLIKVTRQMIDNKLGKHEPQPPL